MCVGQAPRFVARMLALVQTGGSPGSLAVIAFWSDSGSLRALVWITGTGFALEAAFRIRAREGMRDGSQSDV
jgi:hypothetical protein